MYIQCHQHANSFKGPVVDVFYRHCVTHEHWGQSKCIALLETGKQTQESHSLNPTIKGIFEFDTFHNNEETNVDKYNTSFN